LPWTQLAVTLKSYPSAFAPAALRRVRDFRPTDPNSTRAENAMLHYSCDVCKRPINLATDVRHVVKIEVFPAVEDAACGCHDEADGESDADHLEDVQDLLERLDDGDGGRLEDATRSLRFDLCDACRQRFVKNPLGMKSGKQFDFSKN
jgi:hypothetical protein